MAQHKSGAVGSVLVRLYLPRHLQEGVRSSTKCPSWKGMFCMNPSIGRKVIQHYSICLIVALATDKTPPSCGTAGGRMGLFDIEPRASSNSNYSAASDHVPPWQECDLRISKASTLWELFSGKIRSNKHSVSKI